MVQFFVCRIRCSKMAIEDVPERWREAVQARLEAEV